MIKRRIYTTQFVETGLEKDSLRIDRETFMKHVHEDMAKSIAKSIVDENLDSIEVYEKSDNQTLHQLQFVIFPVEEYRLLQTKIKELSNAHKDQPFEDRKKLEEDIKYLMGKN